MANKIYLDNNATTIIDPQVVQCVMQHMQNIPGNPSSAHSYGREAKKSLVNARDSIAACLKVRPEEIVFTSGGTEGANLVIRGVCGMSEKGHILTSATEHSCVYNTVKALEKTGWTATFLDPGSWGAVYPQAVKDALQPNTQLIALMAANNETGVKTDVEAIAKIALEAGVPFYVDAVAIMGKEPVVIPAGVSAMSFSGQKFHGPKGIGFNVIRRNLKMVPHMTGGAQEYGKRAGTENLSAIAGLAKAVVIACENVPAHQEHMRRLRDKLESGLMKKLDNVFVNGEGPRVVNTSNLYFADVDGETLLAMLDQHGIACSHGSACASGAREPSRILGNMGLPVKRVRSSLRFSVSRFNTDAEIDEAIGIIVSLVSKEKK